MNKIPLFLLLCFFINSYADTISPESHQQPLTLGFFPLISTVALYKRFYPLRDYLSETLDREVLLLTAKDFPTFVKRTSERAYDIVITAPHFAVSASDSGKYRIRSTLLKDVQQLIVVNSDSSISGINQLAGKRIGTPPEGALMTLMGKKYLQEAGLVEEKAPVYRAFTSHNAANKALLGNEVDAAIASTNIIRQAIQRGEPLKIISHGLKLPNMAMLVATDKDALIGDKLVQVTVAMSKTEKGKDVLAQIKFPGFRAVSAADYEVARPYMEQARVMSRL